MVSSWKANTMLSNSPIVDVLKNLQGVTDSFLLSVVDSSPDCITILETDGSVTFVNANGHAALEIGGKDGLIGRDWISMWSKESRPTIANAFKTALDGVSSRVEAPSETFNGTMKWWDIRVSPVRNDLGAIACVLAISRDITSLIERERSAHERERLANFVVEARHSKTESPRNDNDKLAQGGIETGLVDGIIQMSDDGYDAAASPEQDRVNALISTGILDTPAESRFDRLTQLTQDVFNVKTVLVSLVDKDRQWFKSRVNMEAEQTERAVSFCSHAIKAPSDVMVVEDARLDPRFAANRLVTGDPKIVFYAGAPLVSSDGYALGTLCIIDYEPRKFGAKDQSILQGLATSVVTDIELAAKNQKNQDLDIVNAELRHRMGNTYAHIMSLVSLLGQNGDDKKQFLNRLRVNIAALSKTQSMLSGNEYGSMEIESFVHQVFVETIAEAWGKRLDVQVMDNFRLSSRGAFMLTLALQELVSNSAKYGALSSSGANVSVTFNKNGETITMDWAESFDENSAKASVSGTGQGSKLLERIVPTSLGGTGAMTLADGVYSYQLTADIESMMA